MTDNKNVLCSKLVRQIFQTGVVADLIFKNNYTKFL